MASEQRQRVRFTGKRTGLDSVAIKGIGRVYKGDQFEASVEDADRWTEELPMADGKLGSDFAKVGDSFKAGSDEVAAVEEKQRDKQAEKAAAAVAEATPEEAPADDEVDGT